MYYYCLSETKEQLKIIGLVTNDDNVVVNNDRKKKFECNIESGFICVLYNYSMSFSLPSRKTTKRESMSNRLNSAAG